MRTTLAMAITRAAAVLVTVALAGVPVMAGGKSFPLSGQKDSPEAKGTAVLEGDRLTVEAEGLKSNAVYSVWFVNMTPTMKKEGAGAPPHSFKTDAKGHGKFETKVSESPVGKWQSIMIVRHPSGDPKDMARMEEALMTKLM